PRAGSPGTPLPRRPSVFFTVIIVAPVPSTAVCRTDARWAIRLARAVDQTLLFSLRENAIAKEPRLAILSPGGVCLDSALQWWVRLLGVSPVSDSEPGSVFGLITGDPGPGAPTRDRAVPVCNSEL